MIMGGDEIALEQINAGKNSNIRVVIAATIQGFWSFPTTSFKNYCYESFGNMWALTEGFQCDYIPNNEIIDNPSILDHYDIYMACIDCEESLTIASNRVFTIAVEHGTGWRFDRINEMEGKRSLKSHLDNMHLILSSTHDGKRYFELFTNTPVLDIPVPLDLDVFKPRTDVVKFDDFTMMVGEVLIGSYDDRPLQLQSIAIASKLGINVATSLASTEQMEGGLGMTASEIIEITGIPEKNIRFYPRGDMYHISNDYMAKSHISTMFSWRPSFGRLASVSASIGVPCLASKYMMQETINDELTFGYMDIDKIEDTIVRLKDDNDFYDYHRKKSLENVKKLGMEEISKRIRKEILPLYMRSDFSEKVHTPRVSGYDF